MYLYILFIIKPPKDHIWALVLGSALRNRWMANMLAAMLSVKMMDLGSPDSQQIRGRARLALAGLVERRQRIQITTKRFHQLGSDAG